MAFKSQYPTFIAKSGAYFADSWLFNLFPTHVIPSLRENLAPSMLGFNLRLVAPHRLPIL